MSNSPDDRTVPGQRPAPDDGTWTGDHRDRARDTTVLDRDGDGVDDRTQTIPTARPTADGRPGDGVDDRKRGRFGGVFGRRGHDRDGDGVDDRAQRDGHGGVGAVGGRPGDTVHGNGTTTWGDGRGDAATTTMPVATAAATDRIDHADRTDHDGTMPTAVAERERWKLGWNSGADLGLLIMRVVLGGVFMAHGAQKVFGWFGGPGLDGFAQQLTGMGFRQADMLAAVTGFTELVGGALVILGIFTPLAAAGLLGVAINAVWMKWNGGLFAQDGGFEFELTLAALAAGVTLTGAGRAALDNGRVWFRHPVVTGWLCLAIGVGAAILVRLLFMGS